MKLKFTILLYIMFPLQMLAQGVGATRSAGEVIPGDNVLRYYRLALPVTVSAFKQALGSDYGNVLSFWRECED